jgi:hypothetical protein
LSAVECFLTPLPPKVRAFRTRSVSSPKHGFDRGVLQTLQVPHHQQPLPLGRREGVLRKLSQVAGIENQMLEARLHELLRILQGAHILVRTFNQQVGDVDSFALVELANSLQLIVDVLESIFRALFNGLVNAFEEFVVNCTIFKMHRNTVLRHKDAIITWSSSLFMEKGGKSIAELVLLPFTLVLPCIMELCNGVTHLQSVHEKLGSFYGSLELVMHLRVFILEAQFVPAPGVVIPGAFVQLFEDGIFVVIINPLHMSLSPAVLAVVNNTLICGEYQHPQTQLQSVPAHAFQYPATPPFALCFKGALDTNTKLEDFANS